MADVRIFQVLVPLFCLLFLISSVRRYRRGKLNLAELLLAAFIWLGIGIFSIIPDTISVFLANLFGIEDNVNAVIFIGLGALLFVQVKLYGIIKRQQEQITELSRESALRDYLREYSEESSPPNKS